MNEKTKNQKASVSGFQGYKDLEVRKFPSGRSRGQREYKATRPPVRRALQVFCMQGLNQYTFWLAGIFQSNFIYIWSLGCLNFKIVLTNKSTVFRMLSKGKAVTT